MLGLRSPYKQLKLLQYYSLSLVSVNVWKLLMLV